MNANAMTAFASNVAVAALNSEGETTQERAMKALVNKIKWQKRERRIIRSAKTTVKRTPHGIKIVKRNNTKNVKTQRGDLICAAKQLMSVRQAMKLTVTSTTHKEELIAAVYKTHRETAIKVGKACKEAVDIIQTVLKSQLQNAQP